MRRALAVVAALAAAGGAAAIVVITATGGSEARLEPPQGEPITVETTVTPGRLLFGDRAVARVRLTIDQARVDPAGLEVAAFFRPFRRVGPIEFERTDLGPTSVAEYRYPIQCIDRACASAAVENAIELPIGVVRYPLRGGDIGTLPLSWPAVPIATRLTAAQAQDLRDRPSALVLDPATSPPPPVSYSVSPTPVGWLLAGAAAAIVLVLGGVVAWRLRGRPATGEPAEPARPALTPLEASLRRVQRSAGEPDAGRRTALDELALRLAESELPRHAREARRLAWSENGPVTDDVDALVREVHRALGEAA